MAVCLAGIIILVLLISFPIILGGLSAANPGTGTPIDGIANAPSALIGLMEDAIFRWSEADGRLRAVRVVAIET